MSPRMTMIPTLLIAAFALSGCGGHSGAAGALTGPGAATMAKSASASTLPPFDPGSFVPAVTNPWLPLTPGTTFTYIAHTSAGVESTVTAVTHDTKLIDGVTTTVVHDRVFLNGTLAEDTFDWYGQDGAGNVWYFGEDTKEFAPDGSVSTEGSWEAGVNGEPGVIMLAHPEVGVSYPQEQAPGIAEDMGKVISLDASVTVPYGSFDHALQTLEWSLIEHGQGAREEKTYVNGLGLVLESSRSGKMRTELISVTHE